MAISGFNTALPLMQTTSPQLAANGSLLAQGGALSGQVLPSAAVGVQEKPGIGTRLVNAMKAAVSELRGGVSPSAIQTAQLAMQAQPVAAEPAPVEQPASSKKPMRAKKVKSAKTWKTLKNPPKQQTEPAQAPVMQPTTGLPANAVQVPGATVYSYDANGNPVAPTMQQLGLTPTMLQGLTGYADQATGTSGPQVNATNQTNLSGLGAGMGVGGNVPVLGAPISVTPASDGTGTGDGSTGGTQAVTNSNSSDSLSNSQGYGYGLPWNSGVATPYSPYGSSMTGAYALPGNAPLAGGVGGFFSRLLGS